MGSFPSPQAYDAECMTVEGKLEMWYEKVSHGVFKFENHTFFVKMWTYSLKPAQLLENSFIEERGVDPFSHSTILGKCLSLIF